MFFFSFFIIININLSLSYIKIPFEKKYKEKITEDNYIDSLLNSKLICELEIGTPNQNLPLTLKLNQYLKLIEQIGEGAFSKLYSAYDFHLNKQVALKIEKNNKKQILKIKKKNN